MSARILIVDDILPNVKLLEAKLSAQYYDVITASSGQEALDKAAEFQPDLVLLDVMMPGMDGFEVCSRIKANPAIAHIPVVMVTALTAPEDKVRGLEAGADDFLSKPINDTALFARVRSLVRLKMTLDEWRARENTASQLGVVDEGMGPMQVSTEQARIFVVEDKEFEQKKISETLGTDGNEVIIANNGAQAIETTAKENFDLIVISLNLDEEDGLRLCSHIKTNPSTRALPILMIGKEEDMDRIADGLEIGAHDYILRPIDRNELLARARTQIRRRRFQERLRSTYEVSLSMALTDSLTGLHNRRYFETHIQKLMQDNREGGRSMAVLILDIDHFKGVNDNYGHNVGDEILKEFGRRLKDNIRSFDLAARIGGEEFVVVLPDIHETRAYGIAERLRSMVSGEDFICSAPEGRLKITTSVGGLLIQDKGWSIEEAMELADKSLYEAKETGRNGVVFHGVGRLNPDEYQEQARRVLE